MENGNINCKKIHKNEANVKTVYVVPKFNSENTVVLEENHPSSSQKNIIVQTSLPRKRKNRNTSILFTPKARLDCNELNITKPESISLISDSTFQTDSDNISIEENSISFSNEAVKYEINEQYLEITMSDDESYDLNLEQTKTIPFSPTFSPKKIKMTINNPWEVNHSNTPQTKTKRDCLSYSNKLEKALNDVYENNFSPLRAAHMNGIKLDTLENHLNGQQQRNKGLMGADPALSVNEEIFLVDWIKCRYKCGFPIKKIDLINKVTNMVIGRKTRFKGGVPGEKWFLNFMTRHPNVSSMGPIVRADSRQIPSKKSINSWFKTCQEYLLACGNLELLHNSSNIGTAEEIILNLNPAANESDEESNDNELRDEESGCVSVLIGACADGEFMPPMPVFSCKKPSPSLVDSVSYGWGIGLSKDGTLDNILLQNYFKNVLIPWLKDNDKLPFILFIGKLKIYLSVETAEFCAKKGLTIYNFYPNSNYVLEPLYKYIIDGTQTSYNSLKRYGSEKQALLNFCPNLDKVLKVIGTQSVIKESFRLCGIFPFNRNAVDFKKCLLGIAQKEAKNFTLSEYTQALEVIESLVGQEKLTDFCNISKDTITSFKTVDKSLFKLWSTIRDKSNSDRKQNNESLEYRHERILSEFTRKLPRPDTYLKVIEDEESVNYNISTMTGIKCNSLDEYKSKIAEDSETTEIDEHPASKGIKSNNEETSKCVTAKLWKQYYQRSKGKKSVKIIKENLPYSKKIKLSNELGSSESPDNVCLQCLKADDKLITCRVCRKSIHYDCMVDNERQIVDHLRRGVLDFEYVCLACS